MKEYKVGDTIYTKGTVVQIDGNDHEQPYCIKFVDRDYGNQAWPNRSAIIDELPTAKPAKPVLPKEVADELEGAKKYKKLFDVYIMRIINDNTTYENSRAFWNNSDDGVIKTLMDAWNNGYTVEKELANLVYVPGTNKKFVYNKRGDTSTRMAKLETPIVPSPVTSYQTSYDQYKPLYWFADEEITKFGLQDCEREEVK
ncbi:DUF1642 domain-containing protein [Lapidilactobacillus gannanensis]|uniref:DUF1642 domain-containing protein n=1 Tax=Lapidilactobacillus gannanensis TaxID=2486002 RepID=A0ABW4BLZ7_9LACO|nr:DUF1642 domain-containing protein [Lapidilactobacillus gannanensis]